MSVTVSDEHVLAWRRRAEREARADARAARDAREALPRLVARLKDEYSATRIILFGSLARGRFHVGSDIDLAVEGVASEAFFYALADLIALSPYPVDLKPIEALEPHFKNRVLSTGEVLG